MKMPYFIWRGKNSKEMGIVVNEYPPIIRPKERTTTITLPGREGTLTYKEGVDIFEPMVKPVTCTLLKPKKMEAVFDWLRGDGMVVFGNEEAYQYEASITEAISMEKMFRYDARRGFMVPFVRHPGKKPVEEPAKIPITVSGERVHNPGNMVAKPTIEITWNEGEESTLNIGGSMIAFTGDGTGAVVDCQMRECFSPNRERLLNHVMSGRFPLFYPGEWPVSWTGGITKVVITPNWRYL